MGACDRSQLEGLDLTAGAQERRPPLLPNVRVFLISLAHGINDMYAAFLPTFIPYIKASLGLDYALSGRLSMIVGFCHIIGQPVIGCLSDRLSRPWLIVIGPILCGTGAVMIPNAGSYGGALFAAGLWGIGSALYHPQGSGGVGYVSSPEKLPASLTLFNIMGTLGVLVSPVVAIATVKSLGYEGLWFTLVPPLLLAPLLWFCVPTLQAPEGIAPSSREGFLNGFFSALAVLFPLWGLAFVRDFVFQGVRFFLPLKVAVQGGSLESVGTVVFCITLGGSLAMVPAERVSKRLGFKRIMLLSMILGSLFLTSAALSKGALSFALYIAGVSCIYSTMPLTVVAAQTLMPQARSAASAIVMGLAWGTANTALYPAGGFADRFGIYSTLLLLGLLPLAGLVFFLSPIFRQLK